MIKSHKNILAAFGVVFVIALSGCGGGGGGGSAPDISTPTPPPQLPPSSSTQHDFSNCYYVILGSTGCFGGAPGFKELRDYVEELFRTGTRDDTDKAYLLIAEVSDGTHKIEVTKVVELHNNGVGGTISVVAYPNGRVLSDALRNGVLGNPDIISRSADTCIGSFISGSCFSADLFDEPGAPIVVASAGNDAGENPIARILRRTDFSIMQLSLAIDNGGNGHFLWVFGLNPAGDDAHPRSSRCHELIKDYCIGAPYAVVDSGIGGVDSEGVFTSISPVYGTSFSAPIVAVALKLLKEADPTIPNTRLIRIACVTANDLGVAGNDATYGCGALNLVELFDEFGNYVGTAQIVGLNSRPFNTLPMDPNTGFVSSDLLSDAGANRQGSALSYAGRITDSASVCMKFLCTFYSNEDRSLQTGFVVNRKNAFAALLFERKDNNFFGGVSSEGSRSDFGDVDYFKGSLGLKTKLSSHDFAVRFDVAKGSAEAKGGRIDHLDGTLKKVSLTAERAIGARSNLSFYAAAAKFSGKAGISGLAHELKHKGAEFGVKFIHRF